VGPAHGSSTIGRSCTTFVRRPWWATVGDETIVATRRHRFWVTGTGWNGNPGAALTGARGSPVSAVKESPTNRPIICGRQLPHLFVGESLLVHDNNCPLPTTATGLKRGKRKAQGAERA
jgi:hypothetical protein